MQHRIKTAKDVNESGEEVSNEMPDIPSSIPFLPYVVSLIISIKTCTLQRISLASFGILN